MGRRGVRIHESVARTTTINHEGFKVQKPTGEVFIVRQIYSYIDGFNLNASNEELKQLNVRLSEKICELLENNPKIFHLDSDGDFQMTMLRIKSDYQDFIVSVEFKIENFCESPLCAHIINVF
jgi:hypothetical protein